jgi:hypothetical protein
MNDTTLAVDINTTSLEELCLVPGFGSALAERVIASRPYSSIEDMMRVPGIGDRLLERIRPYICVSPPTGIELGPEEIAPALAESEEENEFPAAVTARPEETVDILLAPLPDDIDEPDPAAPEPTLLALPDSYAEPLPPPLSQVEPPAAAAITGAVETLPQSPAETESTLDVPVAEVEPALQPEVQKAEPSIESRPSRLEVLLYVLMGGFLALVLGVLATLGILRAVNGDIFYASASRVNGLQSQVGAMSGDLTILQQENIAMRQRLEALEALGGRVSAVEREAQTLRTDLAAADRQIQALGAQDRGVSRSNRAVGDSNG